MSESTDVFAHIGRRYNDYPNAAVQLCAMSYGPMPDIAADVSRTTGLTVVWGPAESADRLDVSYSRAFVAGNAADREYFVVIRGTNFDSLSSWLKQDFDIATAVSLGTLPGAPQGVPADAVVSQGTFNGLIDLLRLRDPQTGTSLVEFLAALQPQFLYVTGHSLGGTLAPPLFAYLGAVLHSPRPTQNMALWSFAGLTPGGAGFNRYFNSFLPDSEGFLWRIQNSLDIAPLCWCACDGVQHVYESYGLHWDFVERDLLADLQRDAAKSGIDYAHPQVGVRLSGTFDDGFPVRDVWVDQALHQHHPTTYQTLVNTQYPTAGPFLAPR